MTTPQEELSALLTPIAATLATVDLVDARLAKAAIEAALPFDGPVIAALKKAALAGSKEGWIHPKANGAIKFGRPAKNLSGFTVDAVLMSTPGPMHRHGQGEIDLCFATSGTPRFDGHSEGWVVFPPGSVHVPTVANGEMLILYFLPGGAIEFL